MDLDAAGEAARIAATGLIGASQVDRSRLARSIRVKLVGMLIETERLHLRPVNMNDLDALVALHAEPDVERFMGLFDHPRLIEWIKLAEDDWAKYGYGRAAMVDRATGRFLGRTGLKRWPQFEETEVGWVPYLTAMIRPDNTRSIAVAERLGMTSLRSDTLLAEPVTVYSVSSQSWRP